MARRSEGAGGDGRGNEDAGGETDLAVCCLWQGGQAMDSLLGCALYRWLHRGGRVMVVNVWSTIFDKCQSPTQSHTPGTVYPQMRLF